MTEEDPMAHPDRDAGDDLLQELLWTYGPCGQEDEVRAVIARELQPSSTTCGPTTPET